MSSSTDYYSPHILIYFEVGEQVVRLADVLSETAKLYNLDFAEVPPGTLATLVIVIDGEERRKQVILEEGIYRSNRLVNFSRQIEKPTSEIDELFT